MFHRRTSTVRTSSSARRRVGHWAALAAINGLLAAGALVGSGGTAPAGAATATVPSGPLEVTAGHYRIYVVPLLPCPKKSATTCVDVIPRVLQVRVVVKAGGLPAAPLKLTVGNEVIAILPPNPCTAREALLHGCVDVIPKILQVHHPYGSS